MDRIFLFSGRKSNEWFFMVEEAEVVLRGQTQTPFPSQFSFYNKQTRSASR